MTRRAVFQQIVLTALMFVSAHSILMPPASAAPNRHSPKGYSQNMTPGMPAANGICGILSHLLIRFLSEDTNLKSGQVQFPADDIHFVICDETPNLSYTIEKFMQCTGNPVPWVNVLNLLGDPNTILSLNYGKYLVKDRKNAEACLRRDRHYGVSDPCRVVDVGLAIRQGLGWEIFT